MRAVWVRARADLRRRLLGWVALALLIGIAGGAAIAVAAAARRTDTAYERFLASSAPSDASITESRDFLTKDLDLDQVAALPEVERSARASFLFFLGRTADGRRLSQIDFQPLAMTRGALGTTLDRWKVLEGRRFDPDKVDEVMLDYETARSLHLGVGDEMTLKFIRRKTFDQQIVPFVAGIPDRVAGTGIEGAIDRLPFPDEPEVTFHVVGIVTDPLTFPPIPGQFEPFLRLTPAFTERYGKDLTGNNVLFVDLADVTDLETFRSDVARLGGGAAVFFGLTQADHEANVNRTLHLAAVVLWLLAGLIALAALLVSTQALSRQAFFESSDHPVLRALGMTRLERFATGIVRTTVIALLATVVALVVAIALVAAVADRPGARRRAVTRRRGERRRGRHRHARGVPRRAAHRRADHVALDPTVVAATPPRHCDPPAPRALASSAAPCARSPWSSARARRSTGDAAAPRCRCARR